MLGERLKKCRTDAGRNDAKKLGDMIGFAQSTISLYEAGKRTPDHETLRKMSDIFNVSIDYLLGNATDPPNDNKNRHPHTGARTHTGRDTY